MGGMENFHGGLYEMVQKPFKKINIMSAKRVDSVMREEIHRDDVETIF